VLGDGLWRRRFGGDPAAIGRTLLVDGAPHEVVGVMPPGFVCPPPVHFAGAAPLVRTELWVPLAQDLAGGQRGAHFLTVIARDQFAALLPIREQVLGTEHPDTLATRYNLARWTGEAGDAPAARDQFAALLPMIELLLSPKLPTPEPDRPLPELTPNERKVARLVAEGMTNRQVASRLGLSARTVDFHLHNIYGKLGVTSRTALAVTLSATARSQRRE
jgi:DNA-binding CsgD family transcriptional regulator